MAGRPAPALARALECMYYMCARLLVALRDRPCSCAGSEKWDPSGSLRGQKTVKAQDAYGLQRADIARVLSVAFYLHCM